MACIACAICTCSSASCAGLIDRKSIAGAAGCCALPVRESDPDAAAFPFPFPCRVPKAGVAEVAAAAAGVSVQTASLPPLLALPPPRFFLVAPAHACGCSTRLPRHASAAAAPRRTPPEVCSRIRRTASASGRGGNHERSSLRERAGLRAVAEGSIPGAPRTDATALSTYLSDLVGITAMDRQRPANAVESNTD